MQIKLHTIDPSLGPRIDRNFVHHVAFFFFFFEKEKYTFITIELHAHNGQYKTKHRSRKKKGILHYKEARPG